MTATIIPFKRKPPPFDGERFGPFQVHIFPYDSTWLVTCRDHSWLHQSRAAAVRDGSEIASGFDVGLVVQIGGRP